MACGGIALCDKAPSTRSKFCSRSGYIFLFVMGFLCRKLVIRYEDTPSMLPFSPDSRTFGRKFIILSSVVDPDRPVASMRI